jgi:hypothetical protein
MRVVVHFILLILTSSARQKRGLPSWSDITTAAKETYYSDPLPLPKEVTFSDLSCNESINYLLKHASKPGSFYYLILNGWFLG